MQPFRSGGTRGGTAATSAAATSAAATGVRRRWRLPAVAATTLAAASLTAAFTATSATAASSAAASAGPSAGPSAADPSPPPPAHRVAPGAVNAAGTNYLYYTATDGTAWQKNLTSGVYTDLSGHLIGAPSPIHTGSGFIVFGQGTDHALWYNSGGTTWHSLGGRLTSKPGALHVSGEPHGYSVYVRGGDGAVWARNHTGAGWGPWHNVGGRLLAGTGPSAAYRAGRYVLVVGTNRELYIKEVGVTGFSAAGGATDASPALVNTTGFEGALVGFARGTNNAGWYHRFLAGTPGWHSLGGYLTSGFGGSDFGPTPYGYVLGGTSQVYQNMGLAPDFWTQVTP